MNVIKHTKRRWLCDECGKFGELDDDDPEFLEKANEEHKKLSPECHAKYGLGWYFTVKLNS